MRLGFVGLGKMGTPMALNLLRAGHEVTVWNRTRARAEPLAAEGARVADTPAAAADGAEAIVSMLADDTAAGEAALGGHGIVEGLAPGATHVGMSTIGVAMARLLRAEHEEEGQHYLSAPVFGRPEAAEARQLRIVVAGDGAAVERCRPVFDALGQQTFVVGDDPAHANTIKLAGNFLIASMLEAMGEAFALGRKAGVAAPTLLEVLGTAVLGGPIFANYARTIVEERFEPAGFALRQALKDVRLALAAADGAQVPMPVASLLHDRLLAGVARGQGEADWSSVARLVAADAGL